MISMTREEMIRKAMETRQTNPRPPVPQEELECFPAEMKRAEVDTRAGKTPVWIGRPLTGEIGGPLIINMHGGGFIKEWTQNDELFCRQLLNRVGGCTVDIEYRLAPDYPFPTALYECYDVVKWALEHSDELGADPKKLVIAGHSAGGNFVAGVCMMAKESGDFSPVLAIMDYPPLDLYTKPTDKEQKGGPSAEIAELYNLYYCDRELQKDPLASPVFAKPEQLKDFPNTLIITAENDSLCIEAEEFALMLARAGTEVTLKRFQGVSHGFVIRRRPGYEDALAMMEQKIKEL